MDKVKFSLAFLFMNGWWGHQTQVSHVFTLQQTNTADMLDLAVEYIKDLQTQVQVFWEK